MQRRTMVKYDVALKDQVASEVLIVVPVSAYGYRKIHSNLQDIGKHCGINRVHRLMRATKIRTQIGYRKRRHCAGVSHALVANRLDRNFNPSQPVMDN